MATDAAPIKYSIYQVDRKYLDYLRSKNFSIADPNVTNTYIGPVYEKSRDDGDPIPFFVPVDPCYKTMTDYLMICSDGVLAGFLDFNKIIPCIPEYITHDNSDADLLAFAKKSENLFYTCAKNIIEND